MKKGATPQLKYAWWNKNKAKTLKKTGLGAKLKAYEDANKKVNDKCKVDVLKIALDKLYDVNETAAKAARKCNKTLHKETMDALKKYDAVVKVEAKPLTDDILESEKDLLTLKQYQTKYRPKCETAWRNFDTLFNGVDDALKRAETLDGSTREATAWVKLADSAEDKAKEYLEDCRVGQGKANKLLGTANKHVLFGHGDEVSNVISSLGKLIVQIDSKMGDLKSKAKKLKVAAQKIASGDAQMKLKDLKIKLSGTVVATAMTGDWNGKLLTTKLQWKPPFDPLEMLQKRFDVASTDGKLDRTLKLNGWTGGGIGKFIP